MVEGDFSYSGDPSNSPRDAVRFELGDTDKKHSLLSDAEIDYCLDTESNGMGALAKAAEAIGQKFSREAAEATGDSAVTFASRAQEWNIRARMYRKRSAGMHAPTAGGISRAAKVAARADTDRVQPAFTVGMHDDTGPATSQNPTES